MTDNFTVYGLDINDASSGTATEDIDIGSGSGVTGGGDSLSGGYGDWCGGYRCYMEN